MGKQALYNDEAKRLYVYEGYTRSMLEDYFKGRVSLRTLDSWKEKGNWDDLKKKAEENQQDIRSMVTDLAKIALKAALDDPDPQKIYAAMATVGKMGQKNFMDLLGAVEGEPETEKEKMSLAEMMDVLQAKLEG
ncbi:MAG: hypothetical protein ABJ387_01435 [Balneola sp.]